MSMLVLCDTVYLKKGNYYGIKFNVCKAMLGIYVKYMSLLVVHINSRHSIANDEFDPVKVSVFQYTVSHITSMLI